MLEIYDIIIGDYLKLHKGEIKFCISTGLRQVPYRNKIFYYRLKDHSIFLKNWNKIPESFTTYVKRF